jgi:hypothetical protein
VPDANGKLQLQDYDTGLTARGFDAFLQSDRYQMINFGYRYIARKFPWSWEQTNQVYVINPGTPSIAVGGGVPLTAKNVEAVENITDPYRQRLTPEREDQFRLVWLPLDLTATKNQAVPFRYYVWAGQIYLLPPPQVTMSIQVWFRKFLPDMVLPADIPATPQIMDEVILDAALVRCHRRAHEIALAQEAQSRVDEALGDMLAEDVFVDEERQERVLPDSQWL